MLSAQEFVTVAAMANEKRARQKAAKETKSTTEARRQAAQEVRVRKKRNQAFSRFGWILGAVVGSFVLVYLLLGTDDVVDSTQVNVNYVTFINSDFGDSECATANTGATSFDSAPQRCITSGETLQATFETSEGVITVDLNTAGTVGTTNNFVNLARSGYYDGLEVFRTDPLAGLIESGARTNAADDPGPGYTIPDEASGFSYRSGQLVMSRGAEDDSAGSRYFFTVTDKADALDTQGDFVVFGTVTSGLDVLESILDLHEAVQGSLTGGQPIRTVTVDSVTIAGN